MHSCVCVLREHQAGAKVCVRGAKAVSGGGGQSQVMSLLLLGGMEVWW